MLATDVTDVGASIVGGVGIQNFSIVTGVGNAEAIAGTDDRSVVEYDDDEVVGIFAAANEGEDAVVGVVGINPFETVPVELHLMQSRLSDVEMI